MHTTTSVLFIYWNVLRFDLDHKLHAVIIMSPEILELVFCLLPVYLPFLDLVISPTFTIVILWLSQIH